MNASRGTLTPSPWYAVGTEVTDASARLFCLPYAGGNSSIFRGWQERLGTDVQVVPIRLPGRLERAMEPPIDRMRPLVGLLTAGLRPLLDRPFSFFGISMGALIAYETVRSLGAAGALARRLIVASYPGPAEPPSAAPTGQLSDEEFLEVLRLIGAGPPGLLEHRELMALMLPVIRADFSVTETHRHEAGPPLDLPVTAVHGAGDPLVSAAEMAGWCRESTRPRDFVPLPGGHFMLHDDPESLLTVVADRLSTPTVRSRS